MEAGWFRALTPAVIRNNPYLAFMFNDTTHGVGIREDNDLLDIWSYNMGPGSDHAKANDLTFMANAGADVICVQEAGKERGDIDRATMLRQWAREHEYDLWFGDTPGSHRTPVLVARSRKIARRYSRLGYPGGFIGRGAGRKDNGVVEAKSVVGVRIGRTVILNTHMIASVHNGASQLEKRAYRAQIRTVADMAHRKRGRGYGVVAVGDWNNGPDTSFVAPMKNVGMIPRHAGPTHERKIYDYAFVTGVRVITMKQHNLSSDHDAFHIKIRKAN